MNYEERTGDLFRDETADIFAHCISSDFALGAGIAKRFRDEYGTKSALFANYRAYDWSGQGRCYVTTSPANAEHSQTVVANLVTKRRARDKPTYETLRQSLESLRNHCEDNYAAARIAMPLIGCGLDGLSWDNVSEIIKDVFANTNCHIVVYRLPGTR